jgi:tol-pal system protein YbgF
MKVSFARIAFLLLLMASVSTPVYAASINELEQRVNVLDKRVARMENKIQVLLDMLRRLESIQRDIQLLRGDSERSLHEMELVKGRQRQLYMDIDQRLQALEGGSAANKGSQRQQRKRSDSQAGTEAVAALDETGAERQDTQSSTTGESKPEEQQAYKRGLSLVKEKRYADAIKAFSAFLNEYPQSDAADNAQYWLAEANYGNRNYPAALVEFKKVVENYPKSSKVPGAALKLGYSHYELAQWDQARKVLTSLKNEYPQTAASRLAEERLKRMKREGH